MNSESQSAREISPCGKCTWRRDCSVHRVVARTIGPFDIQSAVDRERSLAAVVKADLHRVDLDCPDFKEVKKCQPQTCNISEPAKSAFHECSRSMTEWISVKESNPIDCQDVIVCNHRGDVSAGFRTFKGEWWAQFCDGELESAVVTHWMPMPDPPEPERRGTTA